MLDQRCPYYTNTHLPRLKSNHNLILIEFHSNLNQKGKRNQKAKLKRFENFWMENTDIYKVIMQSWNDHPTGDTKGKLQFPKDNL